MIFAVPGTAAARPAPDSEIPRTELDGEAKEVAEMEKQLTIAMEKQDTAVLEKIIADYYFDAYQGGKKP